MRALPGTRLSHVLALMAGFLACAGHGVASAQETPAASGAGSAGTTTTVESAGTGDPWSDRQLDDIDLYAARHRDAFVDELVRYFDAPRALVEGLLDQPDWRAGDLYYACAIARAAGRPCRAVAESRARQREAAWQSIAAQVGIEPGSAQSTRIRDSFADSYRHWARPLLPVAGPAPATAAPQPNASAPKRAL